jgi:MFS family permease
MPLLKKISHGGKIFIIFSIMYSCMDKVIGSNFVIYMSQYIKLSNIQVSLVLASSSVIVALTDFPLGNFADKYGRKKTLIIGLLLWGIGILLYGLSTSLLMLIMGISVQYLGVSFISGVPVSWYYDGLSPDAKNETVSVFSITNSLSYVIVVIVGIVLVRVLSSNQRLPFVISSVISLIAIIFIIVFMKENYGISSSEKKELKYYELLKINTKNIVKNKKLMLYIIGDIFEHLGFLIFIFFWQEVFVYLGFKTNYIGIFYAVMMLTLGVGAFSVKKVNSQKSEFKRYFVGTGTLINVGLVFIAFSSMNKYMFIIGVLLFEFSYGGFSTLCAEQKNLLVENSSRVATLSAISSATEFFGAFFLVFLGIITNSGNSFFVWIIACILLIMTVLFKSFTIRKANA